MTIGQGRPPLMAPEKDPTTYSLLTYLWVFGLGSWGGFIRYMSDLRTKGRRFNLLEFCVELSASAFAGVLTFYLCEAAGIARLTTAVLVAISGHMGSELIRALVRWARSKYLDRL